MARQGLNCTLSYPQGKTRRAYQVRADLLSHGMQVIYDESASRVRRAFYPHRLSSAQFTIQVVLKGEDEYRSFTSWLATYADYVLNPNLRVGEFPSMSVLIPSRDFYKKGVPLTGYEWGDTVAKMVYRIPVTFETSEEPIDKGKLIVTSRVTGTALLDPVTKHFYPTGTQLSGQQAAPDGTYTRPVDAEDLADLTSGSRRSAIDPVTGQRRGGGMIE